ncbi:MAG: hypothetical protein AAGK00_01295 [Pseudomonadota bacterium]
MIAQSFAPIFEDPRFEFFVELLQDKVATPQINMLIDQDGSFLADGVIRLEQMATELPPILAHLGLTLDIPYLNRADYQPPQIAPATRAIIERMFEADYTHLGYGATGVAGPPNLSASALSRRHGADLARIGARYDPFRGYPLRDAA